MGNGVTEPIELAVGRSFDPPKSCGRPCTVYKAYRSDLRDFVSWATATPPGTRRSEFPSPATRARIPGVSGILKSRRAASAVSPSGFQIFRFSVSPCPRRNPAPAPLHGRWLGQISVATKKQLVEPIQKCRNNWVGSGVEWSDRLSPGSVSVTKEWDHRKSIYDS